MPNLKVIKRNTNDFSFIETVASLVNNKEHKSGYQDLIDGKTNDKTYFWTALSAVGEEIGEVIYENVLNYVNNAANINTCRLKPLTSIARVLGVSEFSILKNIDAIPLDVKNLMDIFSINRAYLLNANYFNSDFIQDLISSTLDVEAIDSVSENLSSSLSDFALSGYFLSGSQEENVSALNVFGSISEEKYRKYVEECFFQLLSKKLFQSYSDKNPNDIIFENLRELYELSDILLYDLENIDNEKKLRYRRSRNGVGGIEKYNEPQYSTANILEKNGGIDISYKHAIRNYKRAYGVEESFNQAKIVDDIEAGLDFLDNYTGGKLSVLNLEIQERAKTRYGANGYSKEQNTRYSYYNEKEVLDYLRFINDTVLLYDLKSYSEKDLEDIKASYLTWNIYLLSNTFAVYSLNNNYSELTLSNNYTLQNSIDDSRQQYTELCGEVDFADFIHDFYERPYDFDEDEVLSATALSANALRTTAMILRDICFAIVDIREKLKTQSQRNYMTGTKLLIEYILEEYVIDYLIHSCGIKPEDIRLPSQIKDSQEGGFTIKIQEYDDPTEYFNNNKFYGDLVENPINSNDTSIKGLADSAANIPLAVRDFYLNSLNINAHNLSTESTSDTAFVLSDYYYDFMSAVFDIGQPRSILQYDGKDESLKILLDNTDLTDELSLSIDLGKVSAENDFTDEDARLFASKYIVKDKDGYLSIDYEFLKDYWASVSSDISQISDDVEIYNYRLSSKIDSQYSLGLTYGGRPVCYYPWYNYKNIDYATYQSHPYIYNFIEHDPIAHPIENAFYGNANEDLIYELQTTNISVYLEQYGNLRRIWRNGIYDYSGYRSRYENYTHTPGASNSNLLYSLQHYDGTFYPPAIELYKKYWKNEVSDPYLNLSGFDLLSAHMMLCVDNDCYRLQTNEDVPTISSMWHYYSHIPYLKRRTEERQHIVDQLLGLSSYILSVASSQYRADNGLDSKPHDVYKYGLDYEDNSIILLKHYSSNTPTYEEKRQTTGELWFRYNAHPIGFPAFLPKNISDLQQFVVARDQLTDEDREYFDSTPFNNRLFSDYFKAGKIPEVYDFNLDKRGRTLVFNVRENDEDTYERSTIYSSYLESKETSKIGEQNKERTYYFIESNKTEKYSREDSYEFNEFFNTKTGKIYLGYLKKTSGEDGSLKSVEINVKEAPGENAFKFSPLQIDFSNLGIPNIDPLSSDQCRLGFAPMDSQSFSLITKCHIDESKKIRIQNLIGHVSISSDIEPEKRGNTEFLYATSGDNAPLDEDTDKEYDSFDRFTDYILIHEVPEGALQSNSYSGQPLVYALNSDASYIPQYYGLDGQNLFYLLKDRNGKRISYNYDWHNENAVPKQSLELLGYSFQKLNDEIKKKEDTMHEDEETGKITDFDENALLDNTLRVYEDYLSSNFIFQCYNSEVPYDAATMSASIQETHIVSATHFIRNEMSSCVSAFSIELPIEISSLTRETLSNYNILLLNSDGGKNRNPIIAGRLTPETVNRPIYNAEPTADEEYILSVGFPPDKRLRIVGTPNPFDPQNGTFGMDYSNHIFNICGFESELVEKNGKFSIRIKLIIRNKDIDFVLQSGILHLFVYLNTLDEFEKYHYMEPFGLFPYNAALSAWKLPWKTKDKEYLYLDELTSYSWSEISGTSDTKDRRTQYRESLYRELYSATVSTYHVVGHLKPEWYKDPSKKDRITTLLNKYYLMDNIVLSSVVSFDDVYELSSGQITWKISEEDKFRYDRDFYPPSEIDNLLYSKYGSTNRSSLRFNVFDLSNTYIFQLEDPERIAERISKIAVPIGSVAEQFDFVYEDYLSDTINVDVGGKGILNYQEMVYDPTSCKIENLHVDPSDERNFIRSLNELADSKSNLEDALTALSELSVYPEESEMNDNTSVVDYQILSVTPAEISEYLKLYVNWRKYRSTSNPEQEEIELFFNLPNLFMTPYSYRNNNGFFVAEYKPNTYLRIKSGEDNYLNIVLQFKYYDMAGNLCGVRDLPILTYRIFNVSDDKPKFVITKTYEIDNRNGRYLYPDENGNAKVYIYVESRKYTYKDLKTLVDYDYTTVDDFYVSTKLHVYTPIPLQYLNVEMAYDRGKMASDQNGSAPEFVFEPDLSRPGEYSDEEGYIYAKFDSKTLESNLEFTMLAGTTIDESTNSRSFPIEIVAADARDVNGNIPEFVFLNGIIVFDNENPDEKGIKNGAYLARELNLIKNMQTGSFMDGPALSASRNSEYFAGWINEEVRRALIRMYGVPSKQNAILATPRNSGAKNLKTSGTRQSRLDSKNDRVILYSKDLG